jgi:hypothetical protein
LQKGYRTICKSIALAAQDSQLLRLLASAPGSTKIEGGTASAAPSKKSTAAPSPNSKAATLHESTAAPPVFPSTSTTSPAPEEEIQVKPNVTPVFA